MFLKKMKVVSLMMVIFMLGLVATGCAGSKYAIGVATGTTFGEYAETLENVEVKYYKDDTLTLWELTNERLDGVITDKLVGARAINEAGYENLKFAGGLIYGETIAVAIRDDDDTLRQAIDKALADIIDDGTYAQISEKYFGVDILEGIDYQITYPDEVPADDGSLQRVLDAGEITFAMSGGYAPFNYFDDNDELTGFDVEIGMAVAEKLGVTYTPITTDWSGIVEGLRSGRYDGIFGSMAITDEREEIVDFTDPYYYSGAQLIVRDDSKIEGVEDLK
jgi:ABC-type amino acid transport substrate-binding protein